MTSGPDLEKGYACGRPSATACAWMHSYEQEVRLGGAFMCCLCPPHRCFVSSAMVPTRHNPYDVSDHNSMGGHWRFGGVRGCRAE